MLGIAAGVVFLLGAVGAVVVCWKLDRVQKAVRGKFTEDTQDLSAPLSDYVDRAVLPDTLHLNFDMITMLNNQENKVAVIIAVGLHLNEVCASIAPASWVCVFLCVLCVYVSWKRVAVSAFPQTGYLYRLFIYIMT